MKLWTYLFNMDKFTLLVIFGFFLLSAHSLADDCPEAPPIIMDTAFRCIAELGLSNDDAELIGGDKPDGGKLKEFSLCFYKGIGYYKEGAFISKNIKKFLLEANPDETIGLRVYEKMEKHVEEANAVEGDESERTYTFYLHSYDKEMKELTDKLWC